MIRVMSVHHLARLLASALFACALASISFAQETPSPAPADISEADSPFSIGPVEYRSARGFKFGESGLTIGGFATFEFVRPRSGRSEFEIDGPNVLALYEPIEPVSSFAELEIGNLFAWEPGSSVESSAKAHFEQLHAEYRSGDAFNIRLGKFQSPVGRWNMVPAEPFVWTPTQPVMLEVGLGEESHTGAEIFGSFYPEAHVAKYWIYGQFTNSFDLERDENPPNRGVGGRVEYGESRGAWSLGGSLLASGKNGEWSTLGGLDQKMRVGERLELSSELLVSGGDLPGRDFWGVFVESVYPLDAFSPKLATLYCVGRAEHFDPSFDSSLEIFDGGFAWRPRDCLLLKASYRFLNHEIEQVSSGLIVSVSVIF